MKILITFRELEIIRKAADGMDEKRIAQYLMLEKEEVLESKKIILKRIGARNAMQAIMLLAQNGFDLKES